MWIIPGLKRTLPGSRRDECSPVLLNMLPDLTRWSLLGKAQLIRLLQIHPEFSCRIEQRRQTDRGIARDVGLPFDRRFNARQSGDSFWIVGWQATT